MRRWFIWCDTKEREINLLQLLIRLCFPLRDEKVKKLEHLKCVACQIKCRKRWEQIIMPRILIKTIYEKLATKNPLSQQDSGLINQLTHHYLQDEKLTFCTNKNFLSSWQSGVTTIVKLLSYSPWHMTNCKVNVVPYFSRLHCEQHSGKLGPKSNLCSEAWI